MNSKLNIPYKELIKIPEHWIWMSMKSRCYNKSSQQYHWYGGRGIKVCKRWLKSFENFWFDMGNRPHGLTLDRKNNNGNYTPLNCRWATVKEQSTNRRSNRFYIHKKHRLTIANLIDLTNLSYQTIWQRIKSGWKISKIISTPNLRGKSPSRKTKQKIKDK